VFALPELLAVAVVALAVVGSLLPAVPGGGLSLSGIVGYAVFAPDPAVGPLVLAGLGAVAALALAVSLFGGAIAARGRGASTRVVAVAAVAGVALLFVAGPLGVVAGVFLATFGAELLDGADPRPAAADAAWTTVGVLAGAVGEALLSLSVLVGFVAAVAL